MPPRPLPRRPVRSAVVIAASALLTLFLVGHRGLPEWGGWLSFVETIVPWLGIPVLLLVAAAVSLRSRAAGAAVTVLATVYGVLVLPVAVPAPEVHSGAFVIASENLRAGNDRAGEIAADLASREPDVIVLQEMDDEARDRVETALDDTYTHSYVVGTVGVWSRTLLTDGDPLDLGLGYDRALAVDVDTPIGSTRIVVAHLASFRPGDHQDRDEMLRALTDEVAAEEADRLVVIGDLNTATDDHLLAPLLDEMRLVRTSGIGFPATWPSLLPVVALDHALTRGVPAAALEVLPGNGSDHRGITLTIGSA